MLEKAVRLVIIMIVLVFDPLALCLILAANKQFEWVREDREKALANPAPAYEPDDGALTPDQLAQLQPTVPPPVESRVEPEPHPVEPELEPIEPVVQYHRVCPQCGIRVVNAPGIGPFCPNPDCGRGDDLTENPPTVSLLEEHPYVLQKFVHFANTQPLVAPPAHDAAVMTIVPPEETPAVTIKPVEPEEIPALDSEPVAEPEPQDLYEDLEIEQEIVSGIQETIESEPEDLYQDWSEQDLEQVAQDLLDTVDQQELEQALEELKAEFELLTVDAEPEADTEESQETTQPEPEPEQTEVDGDNDIIDLTEDEVIKAAMRAWKADNPNDTLKHQRQLLAAGRIDRLPWMPMSELQLTADNEEPPAGVMRGFGAQFPVDANKGDSFMRVDQLPGRLYKHNGIRWIEVNRDLSDQYVYDTAYIDHLIAKIGSGEYDIELLTDSERDQISRRLLND
jgi:hypothetical protein